MKPSTRIMEIATEMWAKLPTEVRNGYTTVGKYGATIVKQGKPIDEFIPRATMQYLDEVENEKKDWKLI